MGKNWMTLLQNQNGLSRLMETNQATERFGLALTSQDAELILEEGGNVLREMRRVEFGEGIIPRIIHEFCDSAYIDQSNYVKTLLRLQEIFYLYKNEMLDEISDSELLHFMKEQFESICFGDLDYLEGTCLSNFAQAVRAGYSGYKRSEGRGEYEKFDEVTRWDYDLYFEALKELCWG